MRLYFRELGAERGDCTKPYKAPISKKPYTVGEFIDDVMYQRSKDWGYIELYSKRPCSFNDRPIASLEYHRGKTCGSFSDNDRNREIEEISADGGWSRMDYMLIVKEEDEDDYQ